MSVMSICFQTFEANMCACFWAGGSPVRSLMWRPMLFIVCAYLNHNHLKLVPNSNVSCSHVSCWKKKCIWPPKCKNMHDMLLTGNDTAGPHGSVSSLSHKCLSRILPKVCPKWPIFQTLGVLFLVVWEPRPTLTKSRPKIAKHRRAISYISAPLFQHV